jgi:hypothetical protein
MCGGLRPAQFMRCAVCAGVLALATSSGVPVTASASASPPVNTSPPVIQPPAGESPAEVTMPQVGRVLIGNAGTWAGATYYSYRWEHCDTTPATAIPGAINTTYQIAPEDVGHTLCFFVTAFNAPSSSAQATSTPTGVVAIGTPLNRSAPVVSGPTQVGQTLIASTGRWDGTMPITFMYQWRRCDSAGAKCGPRFTPPSASPTYVLQNADLGHTIVAYVTATNTAGSSAVHSHPTAVVTGGSGAPPPNAGAPPKRRTPPAGINSRRLQALLLKALRVHGSGATIRALLQNGGYSFSFAAPSAGRLAIAWLHPAAHGRRILVATLNIRFHKSRASKIKLILTGNGRKLLRRARKMKVTAQGRFTPVGHRTTSATRQLTLHR